MIPEDAVILAADPISDKTVEEMQKEVDKIRSTQELVDAYALVYNKFWYIEDDIYDYDEGTENYNECLRNVELWEKLMESLENQVISEAKKEGLLAERPNFGTIKQLEAFMKKYGYRDGRGWWIEV
jgi:hypothetical protein